jgi:hypothetical protein
MRASGNKVAKLCADFYTLHSHIHWPWLNFRRNPRIFLIIGIT